MFAIGNFFQLSMPQREERVREYFAWSGERDENRPFSISYIGLNEFDRGKLRSAYSAWVTKRNYIRVLEDQLLKTRETMKKMTDYSVDTRGYSNYEAWSALLSMLEVQKHHYLEVVGETNAYRKAYLVWDSTGIVPIDFKTLMDEVSARA